MHTLSELGRQFGGRLPRPWLAAGANLLLLFRRGDQRRFAVDSDGRWINRQPGMTIVSPDLHTSHQYQLRSAVRETWCHDYIPREGDLVIDVGAGIGEEAVVFSEMVGASGRVVSIEAHPRTFACLEQTIARSRLSNVTPVHCAISDRDAVVRISDDEDHLGNTLLEEGGIEVPGRSLDSLARELGIDKVGLLKMNIEGAERTAIRGMGAIAPAIGHVAISCHDFVADRGGGDFFRTRDAVSSALVEYGFSLDPRREAERPWLRDIVYATRAPSSLSHE